MDHDDEFDHEHFNQDDEHNAQEQEEEDEILINVPMDEFSGEIDLDDIQRRLSLNIAQYRRDREQKRNNILTNVKGFIYTIMGWGVNEVIIERKLNTEYLSQLFNELDKDGGGFIDRVELFEGFIERGAGDRFTSKEITLVIDFIDKDGDGEISFNEFIDMFGYMEINCMEDLIEKSYLYVLFNQIDDDGSGQIDYDELKHFFISNGLDINESEIKRLMKQIDTDGNMELDFHEFYQIFNAVKSFDDLVVKSRLHVIFNQIDTDGSGSLEFDEIQQLFKLEKIDISDKELKSMMAKIDENNDGVIDFDEFEQAFSMITDLHDLVNIWQNMSGIDVGSDLSIGSGLSQPKILPIIAGGCGGIMSRTLTAPLERAKLLAQTGKYSGNMIQTFGQIIERQGFWRGLWKGNFYGCLRIFPFAGCVTFTYTMFLRHIVPKKYRDRINDPKDPVTNLWRFSAGLTAGCMATTITYPLDLLKANEATDMTHTKGQKTATKEITFVRRLRNTFNMKTIRMNLEREMKENNIRSFKDAFRGLVPTIFAVPFFIGMQNMSYDFFRIYLTSEDYMNVTPSIQLFAACGCAAGITAQSIVYPMDVIRRRIQTNTLLPSPEEEIKKSSSNGLIKQQRQSRIWINGVINLIRTQGIKPFFAGLGPTYLKVMPSVAISVTTRDILLGRLNKD